jgi:hypothetical protein
MSSSGQFHSPFRISCLSLEEPEGTTFGKNCRFFGKGKSLLTSPSGPRMKIVFSADSDTKNIKKFIQGCYHEKKDWKKLYFVKRAIS